MKIRLLPDGRTLKIATEDGIVGATIWPAASTLCDYLAKQKTLLSHKRQLQCLELGSGTGIVGLFAASLGFQMVLTDHKPPFASVIPSVPYNPDGTMDLNLIGNNSDQSGQEYRKSDRLLRLLQANVDQNQQLFASCEKRPRVMELDWTKEQHIQDILAASEESKGYDLVIGSDLTYSSELHQFLAETMARLLRKNSAESIILSRCLLAHQDRISNLQGKDCQLISFEKALRKAELEIYKRQTEQVDDGEGKMIHVNILELRHSSSMIDSEGSCLYR